MQDKAAAALKALGPAAAPLVTELLPCLKSHDRRVRRHAAEILGCLNVASHDAIQSLINALADDDAAYQAALSLGQLGRNHTNVLQALSAAAQDPKFESWAVVSMEAIGRGARPALPLLARLAGSQSFDTRVATMKTIALIGPDALPALAALTNALSDHEPWVRKCAAIALGRIGPSARDAIPALRRRSQIEDYDYARADVARALWRIDREQLDVVLPLTQSILTNNLSVAFEEGTLPHALTSAIDLLGELGTNATRALPSIANLIRAEDPVLAFNAAWAAWRIAPELHPLAESTLEKLLGLERYAVDPALAIGGPLGQGLVELKRKRESYHIRLAALGALWQTEFADKDRLRSFLGQMIMEWAHWTSMKHVIPESHVLVPALNELLADSTLTNLHPFVSKALLDIEGTDGERW